MDGPHLVGAKQIPQVGGNGGKPAPVHADEHGGKEHKKRAVLCLLCPRQQRIKNGPKNEVNAVNRLAPGQI